MSDTNESQPEQTNEQRIYATLYTEELFIDTVDEEYKCSICLCVLKDPVQLECEHPILSNMYYKLFKARSGTTGLSDRQKACECGRYSGGAPVI